MAAESRSDDRGTHSIKWVSVAEASPRLTKVTIRVILKTVHLCSPFAAVLTLSLTLVAHSAQPTALHDATAQSASACDPICQLLRKMAIDEVRELTVPTTGNFSAAAMAPTCPNFDGSPTVNRGSTAYLCTGARGSPFTSEKAIPDRVGATFGLWAYSGQGISPDTGEVLFMGGGHAVPNPVDSSVFLFNSESAAASLLTKKMGGNWSVVVKGGRLITDNYPPPSWNRSQTDCNHLWVTTNVDGKETIPTIHSYWGILAGPPHIFFIDGAYATPCGGSQGGAYIVHTNTGDTLVQGGIIFRQDDGGGAGGEAYDRADGNIYSLAPGGAFTVFTNLLSTPRATKLTGCGWGSEGISARPPGYADIIFRDPVSAGMDYLSISAPGTGYNQVRLYRNITAVSSGACSFFGFSSAPKLQSGSVVTECYDPDAHQILFDDGTGHLAQLNFHGSSDHTKWTVDSDTAKLTGDKMALYIGGSNNGLNASSTINTCAVLSKNRPNGGGLRAVIMSAAGRVYIRRMP